MAEEEVELEAPESGGKKNIIIFAVVLVVAIEGSVGGTLFFLGGDAAEEVVPNECEAENANAKGSADQPGPRGTHHDGR